MTVPTDPSGLAAHAFLDMLTAMDWDDDPTGSGNGLALTTAFERFNDIGAVSATVDDLGDDLAVTVDIGPLLNGAGFLLQTLVGMVVTKFENLDQDSLIAELREHVDEHHPEH